MTLPVSQDHPNLLAAAARLRRLQWVWGLLAASLGGLALAGGGLARFGVALGWIILAALLVSRPQPLLLACVAVAFGFSLIFLIPGVDLVLGPDPLLDLLGGGLVGLIGMALVRVVLMATAWNQLFFYRLLYGTAGMSGLSPDLPVLPEVIANLSDRAAWVARLSGFVGLLLTLAAVPLRQSPALGQVLSVAYSLSVFAVGLGLGAAFSPTQRRSVALAGVALGMTTLVLSLLVGRAFIGP
ncbi:MAG TPA: hypothetical protein VFI11_13970 [Anaerolineales bacterium]|nr:hypothetical protein [Anaerolineales bacterium]